MRSRFRIGPFGALNTAFDPRYLPEKHGCSEKSNIRDNGLSIVPRLGYFNMGVKGAVPLGMFFLAGYNTAEVLEEEYVIVNFSGGTYVVKSFSHDDLTELATLYTSGLSVLNPYDWWAIAFKDQALITDGETVYFHNVGDPLSWQDADIGDGPALPVWAKSYPLPGNSDYLRQRLDGMTPAGTVFVGVPTAGASVAAANSTAPFAIGHPGGGMLGGGIGYSKVTFDLTMITGGTPDFRQNDFFGFSLRSRVPTNLVIEPLKITFETATEAIDPDEIQVTHIDGQWNIWVKFNKADRDEWTTYGPTVKKIIKMNVEYEVTSNLGTGTNYLDLYPIWLGGMDYFTPMTAIAGGSSLQDNIDIGFTFQNSTLGLETEISPIITKNVVLDMRGGTIPGFTGHMGVHIQLTGGSSAVAGVDTERWYVRRSPDGPFYRFREQLDTVGAWTWEPFPTTDPNAYPDQGHRKFRTDGVVSMFAYRGSVVWLYKGGDQNVKYSAIGSPFQQYTTFESPTDPNLGADYSMADNFGDEPLAGFDIGRSVLIIGHRGAYAQSGPKPRLMSPVMSIPLAPGGIHKNACCKWQAGGGQFGVAYLDLNFDQIWFIGAQPSFDGEIGYDLHELSLPIRGFVKEWLLGSEPNPGVIDNPVMWSDKNGDLWVMHKRRVLAFRKQIGGDYAWEPYEYSMNSQVAYMAPDHNYGMRGIMDSGEVVELESRYIDGQLADGSQRDGGLAMPAGKTYITSRAYFGGNSSINRVYRDADRLTDVISVEVTSSRYPNSPKRKRFPSGDRVVRFGPSQQGHWHIIKIIIHNETAKPLHGINFDLMTHGGERPNE